MRTTTAFPPSRGGGGETQAQTASAPNCTPPSGGDTRAQMSPGSGASAPDHKPPSGDTRVSVATASRTAETGAFLNAHPSGGLVLPPRPRPMPLPATTTIAQVTHSMLRGTPAGIAGDGATNDTPGAGNDQDTYRLQAPPVQAAPVGAAAVLLAAGTGVGDVTDTALVTATVATGTTGPAAFLHLQQFPALPQCHLGSAVRYTEVSMWTLRNCSCPHAHPRCSNHSPSKSAITRRRSGF